MSAPISLEKVLQAIRRADPSDLPELLAAAGTEFGATDVVLYLVDFEQQVLEPLPDRNSHADLAETEHVGTTLAGRALLQRKAMTAARADGVRVWVPVVEGSDPTGVLALTVPDADDEQLAFCEDLGLLAGYLLATHARVTDVYNLYRRRQSMSLAASMQWDLLPPLALATRHVAAAGMVEPAYQVGGDCFDYAINGSTFHASIMDSMGHGVRSSLLAALAGGSYRHDRREGRPLPVIHRNIDAVVRDQFDGDAFVTGQLASLELTTGSLRWINAGHLPPLLIRHGRVIGTLDCAPALPWGLGPGPRAPEVAKVSLEPGDSVLFYTDGVVEARSATQRAFGAERLADLAGQHASDHLPVPLIVRLLIHAVLEHHEHQLRDDATIFLVQWAGPDGG